MSSINPNNIDGTYPIAGQDNDSQGFRNNFTNIRNNLTFAKSEIEALEQNVILKSALAGSTLNNNMNNTPLVGAQISRFTETLRDIGPQGSSIIVNWSDAHFQLLEITASTALTLANWPTSGVYAKLRLQVEVNSISYTLTLPSAVPLSNANSIQGCTDRVITFPTAGTYLFEFSTYDGGTTVSVQDLTRNYVTHIVDYQYLTPANASLSNVSPRVSTVIVDPAGTIAEANISLPGNTAVSDGHTISFAFGATITSLTLFGNGATVLGGLTTAGVATPAKYIYKTSTNKWYRQG